MAEGNKKFAIVGVSSVLLVALCAAVAIGVIHSTSKDSHDESGISTSQKSVKQLCNSADYKDTCEKSLAPAAKNSSEPKDLIRGGFSFAMDELKGVLNSSSVLDEAEKDPRTKEAYETCKELVERSIDEFVDSSERMGNFDFGKLSEYADDLTTWLTAAMSHQGACLDSFENTTGDAGENMKKLLKTTREITSNALAMVNEFRAISGDISKQVEDATDGSSSGRKLLSVDDGFPSWVNAGQRRLLLATPGNIKPDAVVAKDGSGKFKTITQALSAVPKKNTKRFVIYVKAGIYQEQVLIDKKVHDNVMLLGDGPTKTKITGSKNFIDGTVTFKTATVAVTGLNFIAKNIGFENAAGAAKHQAVALRVGGDHAIFYNCQMDGYQDTLYTHSHRQFYRDCTISGTIDFVFGDAETVLQNCKLVVRKPLINQQCIVTAQGRDDRKENSAIVLQNCTISGDPAYIPNKLKNRAYLGRPWKQLSRTIIMNTRIDDIIAPEGWLPWQGDFGLKTCFYGEYNNRGPGSAQTSRVKWPCIKKISPNIAKSFTPGVYIRGDMWVPSTGVPFTAGMINA